MDNEQQIDQRHVPRAIEGVLLLRGKIEVLEKEVIKLKASKLELENYLRSVLFAREETQTKTDDGVAFLQEKTSVTMADRPAFLEFVILTNNFDLFTNHVDKTEVLRLTSENVYVPGVNIDTTTVCHVRKA